MDIRESYRTLELDYGASPDEVRQGYKDMVRVWHPDRFYEDPRLRKKAEEKLKEINRAYGDLMDFFSREMAAVPLTDSGAILRWWRKAIRHMALVFFLIGRLLYQNMRHHLSLIKPEHILRVLIQHNKGHDGRATGQDTDHGDAKKGHGNRMGIDDEPNFRSVFDEVAREKRAHSQRGR